MGKVHGVEKHGNSWRYIITVPKDDGGYRQVKKGGYATAQEAQKARQETLRAVEFGEYVERSDVSLGDYLSEWLEGKRASVRNGTMRAYVPAVRRIAKQLGSVPLQKLSPQQVQALYAKLLQAPKPLAPRSVVHTHRVLLQALDQAVAWSLVTKNVASLVKPPRVQQTEMQVWTAAQVQQFIAVARSNRYFVAFLLALTTGMRAGEILGLRWKDVDFDGLRIKVTRSHDRANDGTLIVNAPKTAKGIREIALPRNVVQELKSHRLRQKEERLAWSRLYEDNDLITCKEDGTSMYLGSLRDHWNALQEQAGLPHIRLYDARHTHASLLLQQGVSPKVISERLGHATIGITLDLYGHTYNEMHQQAADKFGDVIFGSQNRVGSTR